MASLTKREGMLPHHGKIECARCHGGKSFVFDKTRTEEAGWRITSNPLAWGNANPEVVVLGFSKGPMQAGDLSRIPHDQIAYRGGRTQLAKILHHIDLIDRPEAEVVDRLIADKSGRFHFGSLVRCTVERREAGSDKWAGTGGGMLDRFIATGFGQRIVGGCMETHLGQLPERTKLIVMLGMGTKGNYVTACRAAFQRLRPGAWRTLNEIAYTDGTITVVHAEHFKSQGALIPNWLSGESHPRGRYGLMAREAVRASGMSREHATGSSAPDGPGRCGSRSAVASSR